MKDIYVVGQKRLEMVGKQSFISHKFWASGSRMIKSVFKTFLPIHTLFGHSVKFVINSIPTCCTNSSEEEVFEDTETTTSFDTQTAELLSQLEEFNPQLRLKDIYVYPNQTSLELPPKNLPNSRSKPIVLEPEPDIIVETEQVSFFASPPQSCAALYIVCFVVVPNFVPSKITFPFPLNLYRKTDGTSLLITRKRRQIF